MNRIETVNNLRATFEAQAKENRRIADFLAGCYNAVHNYEAVLQLSVYDEHPPMQLVIELPYIEHMELLQFLAERYLHQALLLEDQIDRIDKFMPGEKLLL